MTRPFKVIKSNELEIQPEIKIKPLPVYQRILLVLDKKDGINQSVIQFKLGYKNGSGGSAGATQILMMNGMIVKRNCKCCESKNVIYITPKGRKYVRSLKHV